MSLAFRVGLQIRRGNDSFRGVHEYLNTTGRALRTALEAEGWLYRDISEIVKRRGALRRAAEGHELRDIAVEMNFHLNRLSAYMHKWLGISFREYKYALHIQMREQGMSSEIKVLPLRPRKEERRDVPPLRDEDRGMQWVSSEEFVARTASGRR